MLRITNLSVPFDDESPLRDIAARRLKLPPQAVLEVVVVRKAIDARRYHNAPIQFVYVLDVKVDLTEKKIQAKYSRDKQIAPVPEAGEETPVCGTIPLAERPVVVGFGPAGIMAALALAERGYRPLVLERGYDVDRRAADIERFWQGGALDERSNVQFGEGGAGTFSDGKLTTRISDPRMRVVLDAFVEAGAPEEIKWLHKPHIGTDRLRTVVKNLRERIVRLGGAVRFGCMVTDLRRKDDHVAAVEINGGEWIPCSVVLLGIGHSARDTYAMLHGQGIAMESKPFAIGVRIEHPQEMIDRAQYGADAGHPRLGAADYALTYQDAATGRGVYSFCMCPGGYVVAAASEAGGVVTNGMSDYGRDSGIANSALLVAVRPADFGAGVLDGIAFQRAYEALAFRHGGGDYRAPAQTVGAFLRGDRGDASFLTEPTYRPGVKKADFRACLPAYVWPSLARALPAFGAKLKGFDDPGAVMTGLEMRSSAPCRILRGKDYVSVNAAGLYPMGEGAGYAGGIMSAAVDGLNAAVAVMCRYRV